MADLVLNRLGQISMRAGDLARAVAFYRDVLRVPFLFDAPNVAFFDLGGVRLMLAEPSDEAYDHPGSILYFEVEDLRGAHRDLEGRGVRFDTPPRRIADLGDREVWMAFFKDSESNQLAIMAEVAKA